MKNDFQKQLDLILARIKEQALPGEYRPRLLLHACCAPCSSYVLEYLAGLFKITVLYYNPNIYPETEYERRLNELIGFLSRFLPAVQNGITLVQEEYNPEDFLAAVGIATEPELAKEEERGERCRRCYELRLARAYEYACSQGYDYFCTTLSISPFKDAFKINTIGEELEGTNPDGPKWLVSDFKKRNGFKRSLELSKEYGLYRQQYCGCIFSRQNTAHKCAYAETENLEKGGHSAL